MTNILPLMISLTLFVFYMLLPHIVQPTRIINNSKTLIDNIYSNVITPNNILGSLTATISHHLSQIVVAPYIFSNLLSIQLNIFERDWSKFDQENFVLDYLSVDLENLIKSNDGNVDQSFFSFLTKFSSTVAMSVLQKKLKILGI